MLIEFPPERELTAWCNVKRGDVFISDVGHLKCFTFMRVVGGGGDGDDIAVILNDGDAYSRPDMTFSDGVRIVKARLVIDA
jgi:hypothetical protein